MAAMSVGEAASSGVYHVAAAGWTSRFGFAERILRLLAAREPLRCRRVVPIATAEYAAAARRPCWSVLDTTKFQRTVAFTPLSWEDQLDGVVREL
jgi:dTDP-4-dehydrorhamnose reductase